jgi:hypothetical protein
MWYDAVSVTEVTSCGIVPFFLSVLFYLLKFKSEFRTTVGLNTIIYCWLLRSMALNFVMDSQGKFRPSVIYD